MIHEKLNRIQTTLSAPKNQRNSFGGYNYRSCEDILEALKPLLKETKTVINLSDTVCLVGDRIYVQATATIIDMEDGTKESATALARESLSKKGMDDSQITGTASSYARKYALNGLFAIDDNKDADTDFYPREDKKPAQAKKTASNPVPYSPAPATSNMDDLPF